MGYGFYFLFTILHQSMSRGLKLRLMSKRNDEFRLERIAMIELGGHLVAQSPDSGTRDRAVDWLLEMQDAVATWPDAQRAVQS